MNFSPFGSAFPAAVSQFISKEEAIASSSATTTNFNRTPSIVSAAEAGENRYQPHFVNHQPITVPISNKYQGVVQQPQSLNNSQFSQNSFVQQQQPNAEMQSSHETRRVYSSEGVQQQEIKEKEDSYHHQHHQMSHPQQQTSMPPTWQSLAAPGSTVADYLSHLPASTLPISLHHFLKYSTETIKKETESIVTLPVTHQIVGQTKKKKKKRPPKEKKHGPKPGEIRLTTALDGTTLFCCPECHMAYREKELLEQHLIGHKMERRFICDICGAGLKRKDHLTRHKQSHNPERPFVCTICNKAFKRKEQLTLHLVIHSGEKRHICPECNKGFYRKDHLRKHTRSHISRRVKAEMSGQVGQQTGQAALGALHQQTTLSMS